jgi:hypothetical protein
MYTCRVKKWIKKKWDDITAEGRKKKILNTAKKLVQ